MPKDCNKNALAFGPKHDRVLKKGGHVFQKLHQLFQPINYNQDKTLM